MKVFAETKVRPECEYPILFWVFCSLMVLLFSAFLCIFTYAHYKQEEVRRLIIDIQQLKIGMTSEDELRTLFQKYGGTFYTASGHEELKRTDGRYELRISSPFIVIRNHFFHVPWQRPWTVLAGLDVNKGHLDRAWLEVAILRSDGVYLQGNTWINLTNMFGNVEPPYAVLEPPVTGPPTEAVAVHLRPDATKEEMRRAFDFNLRCLTGLRECQHVCEFMPSAWKDLPLENRLRYPDGREIVIDSECRTALTSQR
jgi:hypothetical protein